MTAIKCSERFAKRMLSTRDCEIFVPKASSWFFAQCGIKGGTEVFCPEESIFVPLEDIERIKVADRFGSEAAYEIEWEKPDLPASGTRGQEAAE